MIDKSVYNYMYTSSTSSSSKELDLRQELENFLYGAVDEIPKGRTGLIKQIRRDDDGNPIRCPCRDRITDEQDQDYYCRICLGAGYLWDERKIVYYRNNDSFRKVAGKNQEFEGDDFFVEYDSVITTDDVIITLKLDSEGNFITPVERDKSFAILSVDHFRSDNGRIEFWRIRTAEGRPWSVWYGVQNRQHQ